VAKAIIKAAWVSINAVDRSANASKVELTIEYEEKDSTVFTSNGAKEVLGGLEGSKLGVTFKNDHAVGALDDAMWALRGLVVPFAVRLSSAAVSTSNPQYGGSVLIGSWTPISGSPGDLNEASYNWTASGLITRVTA
jgi:hypothetical protein